MEMINIDKGHYWLEALLVLRLFCFIYLFFLGGGGKVMFLLASVILFTGGGGIPLDRDP